MPDKTAQSLPDFKNVAESWAACQEMLAEGLRRLNEELGTAYRSNRLYEWMDGTRSLPAAVRAWMLQDSMREILAGFGIQVSPAAAKKLAAALR